MPIDRSPTGFAPGVCDRMVTMTRSVLVGWIGMSTGDPSAGSAWGMRVLPTCTQTESMLDGSVANGVSVRMAVLYLLLGGADSALTGKGLDEDEGAA